MSLIDRVRHLAGGCTVQQSRAVIAEIYRQIGEGIAMADDADHVSRVLLDAAKALVQQNASETVPDVKAHSNVPEPVRRVTS